jgi:putative ABC transport system permease protein
MDIDALHRMMREGPSVSGGYLTVDQTQWKDFMAEVKKTPRVAATLVKRDQLAAFRKTTAQTVNLLRSLYFTLGVVVAFGVVYNSARIALSERSRDLATLRVVGFRVAEIRQILLGELGLLILVALPLGLLFGKGLALFILSSFATETIRLPLTIQPTSYSIAASVVMAAALFSFATVSRMLAKLDMVGVLKARD